MLTYADGDAYGSGAGTFPVIVSPPSTRTLFTHPELFDPPTVADLFPLVFVFNAPPFFDHVPDPQVNALLSKILKPDSLTQYPFISRLALPYIMVVPVVPETPLIIFQTCFTLKGFRKNNN